jgi:hypothetical protein
VRSTQTKVLILVGLLGVWALVFVLRRPAESPVRSAPPQAGARPGRAAGAGSGIPRLKADLIKVPRAPYPSEVQNIFSSPPPPSPPAQTAGVAGPAATPPAPPLDPFQEEAKQLRYVGFLQAGNAATAFLVRGQEVHTVPVGGLVGGRFRVMEVRDDSVLLASPAGDKEIRLPLTAEAGVPPRAPGPPR